MGGALRKLLIILILSISVVNTGIAQKISHHVLVPAAGIISPKGVNYAQTIGEPVIDMIGAYDHILTQGFQQPRLKITIGDPPKGTGIKTYPNPATDYITVELYGETPRTFEITVLSVSGMVLISEVAKYSDRYWEKRRITISGLSRGFYIVRIISTDKAVNRSFKLEKL